MLKWCCLGLVCVVLLDGGIVKGLGKKIEEDVGIYQVKTDSMHANFTNWGATLMSLYLPNMHGQMGDVLLGHTTVDEYKNGKAYMGATVGRVANRIGGAQFSINQKDYKLEPNEGDNVLHGGRRGFSNVAWKVERHDPEGERPSITFAYESPDGDQGFPGAVTAKAKYTLDGKQNTLTIEMNATLHGDSHAQTPLNMANHAYWNLAGHSSGTVLAHRLRIPGSHITPVDDNLIPTGDILDITGSVYDLRLPRTLSELPDGGYDVNYVLDFNDTDIPLHVAAELEDPVSGRKMELLTNQLGMQLYTAGKLGKVKGKDGALYGDFAGLCLETQGFPDAVNHNHFPSQLICSRDHYHHLMVFRFSTSFSSTSVQ